MWFNSTDREENNKWGGDHVRYKNNQKPTGSRPGKLKEKISGTNNDNRKRHFNKRT